MTEKLPDGPLGEILSELKRLGAEVKGVGAEVKSLGQDQARIVDRIASVENRIDEHQLDTKPIWERALAEISETRNEVQKLAADFREVKRNVRGLNDSLLSIAGDLREMDERLARLEAQIGTHQNT